MNGVIYKGSYIKIKIFIYINAVIYIKLYVFKYLYMK